MGSTTATLTIVGGWSTGTRYRLDARETVVGRAPNCDFVLPIEAVSRRHLRFVREADGFYVEDLGSRNGTLVDGRRINRPTRLTDGDEIQLLGVTLVFRLSEPATASVGPSRTSPATTRALRSEAYSHMAETLAEIDVSPLLFQRDHLNAETKLKAVVELTQNLQLELDLEQLFPRILESAFRIFPQTSCGCLFYLNPATRDLQLAAIQTSAEGGDSSATMRPISRSVAREVMAGGKAVLNVEQPAYVESGPDDSVFDEGGTSCMCAPLVGSSRRACGSIYLDSPEQFVEADLDVLATIAFLAGQVIEQLSLHTARYHAVVDTAADAIITIDEQNVIESANPAAERLFGETPETLIGKSLCALLPALEGCDDQRKAVLSSSDGETVIRRTDGSPVPVQMSSAEFELGGRRHFTIILHDITERKRYERALLQLNENLERTVQQRTGYVKLLQDVTVIANEAENVETAMQTAIQRICEHMQWPVGHVYLRSRRDPEVFVDPGLWTCNEAERYEKLIEISKQTTFRGGEGMIGRVISRRKAEWNVDLGEDASVAAREILLESGLRTALAFPLLMGNRVVGVMQFLSEQAVEPDPGFLNVMNHVGTQLGRVVERRQLQQELVDAVWHQQHNFGQEMHDSIGQQMAGIGMMLGSLKQKLQRENHHAAERVAELAELFQDAKDTARKLAKGMFPVDIDAQGLRSALDELVAITGERCEAHCEFSCGPNVEIRDNNVATHLFRIAQEAMTNAAKHSQARRIRVRLVNQDDGVVLTVADDGAGLQQGRNGASSGMGLRIMRHRANLIGARLSIGSNSAGGTIIRCKVGKEH